MKDLITNDLHVQLGYWNEYEYTFEIEDISKLNLNRYPCKMPANEFEAKQHAQGLKTKCLVDCWDEMKNRIPCNCTTFNAFNGSLALPDCQHFFRSQLPMENLRYVIECLKITNECSVKKYLYSNNSLSKLSHVFSQKLRLFIQYYQINMSLDYMRRFEASTQNEMCGRLVKDFHFFQAVYTTVFSPYA